MRFAMIFEGIDRATKVMGKIMAAEKKASASAVAGSAKTAAAADKATRATERQASVLSRIGSVGRSAYNGVVAGANAAARATVALHQKTVALAKVGLGQVGAGAGKTFRGVALAAGIAVSAFGGAAIAAGSLVGVASQFEKFQTILETTEGSSAKAKAAMAWVSNFAAKTPYELDGVMDSFVQLRTRGLDPTNGLLQALGDTSAAMGVPLMQGVEAMADAVTGENERLKAFGITASKTGNKIAYTYTNAAGKQMTASVKATDRMAIQQKLMAIFSEKYGGSMEKLSATWDGMVSNLADIWSQFQLAIMNAGLFDWMKDKLKFVLDTVNQMAADGTLKLWAEDISTRIMAVLQAAWDFAKGTWEVMKTLGVYLKMASDYVGGWENLAMILAGMAFAPMLISTAAGIVQIAIGLSMLTTSIGGFMATGGLRLAFAFLRANLGVFGLMGAVAGKAVSGVVLLGRATLSMAAGALKGALALGRGLFTAIIGLPGAAVRAASAVKALALATVGLPGKILAMARAMLVMSAGGVKALPGIVAGLARSFLMMARAGLAAIPGLLMSAGRALVMFGASLMATPVGWFIAGVAVIAGAVYLIYRYWEPIKAFFAQLWEGVINAGQGVVDWLGSLDFSSYIPSISWDGILTVLDWASWILPVRWLDLIPGFSWSNIITSALDWLSFIPVPDFSGMFNFNWSDILPDWNWSNIIPDMPDFSSWFSAGKREVTAENLVALDNGAAMAKLAELDQAAGKIAPEVQKAINAATAYIANVSFYNQGAALMDTMAAGIRARAQVAVAEIARVAQMMRDHLPSSPAKVGPLSDIHRLKFGETIAGSIRAEPMVKAMRAAALATMGAAAITAPAVATAATGADAVRAQVASAAIQSSAGSGRGMTLEYKPTVTLPPGTPENLKADFAKMLDDHSRHIAKLMDEEDRRRARTKV